MVEGQLKRAQPWPVLSHMPLFHPVADSEPGPEDSEHEECSPGLREARGLLRDRDASPCDTLSLGRFSKTILRFHSFLERLTTVREDVRLRSRVSCSGRAQIHITREEAAGAGSRRDTCEASSPRGGVQTALNPPPPPWQRHVMCCQPGMLSQPETELDPPMWLVAHGCSRATLLAEMTWVVPGPQVSNTLQPGRTLPGLGGPPCLQQPGVKGQTDSRPAPLTLSITHGVCHFPCATQKDVG